MYAKTGGAIESIQSSAGRELAREDMLMLIQSLIEIIR